MASTKSKLAGVRIDFSPTLAISNLSPLLCRLIFHIRSPPDTTPLLVFINPKSGGNQVGARVPLNTRLFPRARIPHHSSNPLLFFQGVKLMSQFQWLINPRQVFNLMARDTPDDKPQGPNVVCPWPVHNMFSFPLPLFLNHTNTTQTTQTTPFQGLELYKDVENLRILVCGGDGTVGWVLETLDKMGLADRNIPVGTLPLGTGKGANSGAKLCGTKNVSPLPTLPLHPRQRPCPGTQVGWWLRGRAAHQDPRADD